MSTGSVAAVVLAAGQSRRMGGPNKLFATFDGEPLICRSVQAALASKASSVMVVTGHGAAEIRDALATLHVSFVHNPQYADGLSTSVQAALRALPADPAGALFLLADMPDVSTHVIDRVIAAFEGGAEPRIVVPTALGVRGNPVLWSRHFFPDLMTLSGDTGGRDLVARNSRAVRNVELGEAVARDVDTPAAVSTAGGKLPAEDSRD